MLLDQYTTCYATCSIGYGFSTSLPKKLKAISLASFEAIELSFPDLISYAQEFSQQPVADNDWDLLCEAAKEVRHLCSQLNLKIAMLQPFSNFEGWPRGSREREKAFEKARGWVRVMDAVGTDMLQVGATDTPNLKATTEEMARDLAELAEILDEKGFYLAFENWCWASYASTWQKAWELVKTTQKRNVGLCLDTFQTAGSEWADPTTDSGLIEDVDPKGSLENVFQQSLDMLKRQVPAEKIYILQISDAYRMIPPLKASVDSDGLRPRGQWSHKQRPLPFEGYLRVKQVVQAVLDTGFQGLLSIEIFDRKEEEKSQSSLETSARRGMEALSTLISE